MSHLETAEPVVTDHWNRLVEWIIPAVNVVALLAGLVIIADVDFSARPAFAAFLFLLGPGSGLVQVVGRFDTAVRFVLVVGLSVACSVLTAELLLALHGLDSTVGAIVLTLITASGLVANLYKLSRSSR